MSRQHEADCAVASVVKAIDMTLHAIANILPDVPVSEITYEHAEIARSLVSGMLFANSIRMIVAQCVFHDDLSGDRGIECERVCKKLENIGRVS